MGFVGLLYFNFTSMYFNVHVTLPYWIQETLDMYISDHKTDRPITVIDHAGTYGLPFSPNWDNEYLEDYFLVSFFSFERVKDCFYRTQANKSDFVYE